MREQLDRILETALYAEDLAPASRFYEDVLELAVVSRVEGRHTFFRVGKGMLLLFQPQRTAQPGPVPPHGATGPGHVAFAVDEEELAVWRSRLAERGVAVEQEVEWPGGGHSLYLRDPAGNCLELATPKIWPLGD